MNPAAHVHVGQVGNSGGLELDATGAGWTRATATARRQLLKRRERLVEVPAVRRDPRLAELLRQVDQTLHAIAIGSWGTCSGCREAMSLDQLAADPLATICLDCLAVDERRALERDLEAAARVQRTLLPPAFDDASWEVAWSWHPKSAVSGDHLDVVPPAHPGGPRHLLLGDVAGKGVAAALLQSHLHALFRALLPTELAFESVLSRVNRLFADATVAAAYATLLALRLEADGRAAIINAGHPRPLLADHRGVRPIEGGGVPLGLFGNACYEVRELQMRPGETLLLYTDGLVEGECDEEEYGIGRASAALRRHADAPLAELLAGCLADHTSFLAGQPRGDDLTLVALRRRV